MNLGSLERPALVYGTASDLWCSLRRAPTSSRWVGGLRPRAPSCIFLLGYFGAALLRYGVRPFFRPALPPLSLVVMRAHGAHLVR